MTRRKADKIAAERHARTVAQVTGMMRQINPGCDHRAVAVVPSDSSRLLASQLMDRTDDWFFWKCGRDCGAMVMS